jgi:hypothetical protein
MAFDLNDNDSHLRVNKNDVGLMILCRASEANIGDDHPVAIKRPDERLNNDPFGVVLQRLHWKICRDQLSHFRLFRFAVPDETATGTGPRERPERSSPIEGEIRATQR